MEKPTKKRAYKGRQVNVRLSDEEYADLEARTIKAGLTVPQVVKQAALGAKIPPRKPPKLSDAEAKNIAAILRDLAIEKHRIGANLNQIAKHLNQGGEIPPGVFDNLDEANRLLSVTGEELTKTWQSLN